MQSTNKSIGQMAQPTNLKANSAENSGPRRSTARANTASQQSKGSPGQRANMTEGQRREDL